MNVNVFEAFINSTEYRPGEEKRAGLLVIEDSVQPTAKCILLHRVDGSPNLFEQSVGLGVSKADVV
jgi:hypothetical protein